MIEKHRWSRYHDLLDVDRKTGCASPKHVQSFDTYFKQLSYGDINPSTFALFLLLLLYYVYTYIYPYSWWWKSSWRSWFSLVKLVFWLHLDRPDQPVLFWSLNHLKSKNPLRGSLQLDHLTANLAMKHKFIEIYRWNNRYLEIIS